MTSRPTRTSATAGILFLLLGAHAFAGDSTSDSGVPSDAGASDAGTAAPATTESPSPQPGQTGESGAGLFEQSQSPAGGTAASAAGGAEPAAEPFKLSGYVRGDMYVGKVPGYSQGDIKAGYGETALIVRTKKEPFGDGFAELRLRYGVQGEQRQQATVDIREAYVNAYVGPVDLRLGKQIIVWGRADVLNPTNNLTPNDLRVRSPIEDDRRIGNLGARAFLRLAPVRIEGVWLPLYIPSELPPVSLPTYVAYGDPHYPRPELEKGLAAGRVHLELPAIEMSVSYLRGYAPLPGLVLSSLTVDPTTPEVLVSRTAYRHQVFGFDFSTAIGDIVAIRGEVAYRRPFDYKNLINSPRPDLQYALGFDRTFGSVSVIVQYLGRYAFDWEKQNGPIVPIDTSYLLQSPSPTIIQAATERIDEQLAKTNQILFTQTERIQHLATARVEWLTAHDTLSLCLLGMVNFSTQEWMAAPKLGYRLSDSMMAYLGAEILTGPSGTLFGLVDQTLSAGYLELRSTF